MSLPAYLGGSEMPSLSEESPGSILQYAEGRKPKACGNCRSAHVGCDMQRPCKRCASKGLQDSCDDYGGKPAPAKARKPAKKKKETEEAEEENANGYQQQANNQSNMMSVQQFQQQQALQAQQQAAIQQAQALQQQHQQQAQQQQAMQQAMQQAQHQAQQALQHNTGIHGIAQQAQHQQQMHAMHNQALQMQHQQAIQELLQKNQNSHNVQDMLQNRDQKNAQAVSALMNAAAQGQASLQQSHQNNFNPQSPQPVGSPMPYTQFGQVPQMGYYPPLPAYRQGNPSQMAPGMPQMQQAPQRQVNLASPNGAPRPMQPMMPGPSLSQPIGQMGAPMQGVTSPRPALPNQSMSQLQQQQAQKRGRKTKPPTPVMSSPKPPSNLYSGLSFGISPEEMNDPLFNRTLNVYPTPTPVESTEVVPLYESPTFETLSNLVKAEPEEGLASFLSIIQNFNNNAQETPTFENPTTSQQELLQVVKTLQEEIDPDKKTQNTTALDNYLNTFKMATNALAPPSLIWERNGTILFANPAFCHLTGFNMSMIPPKPDSISGFFKMPEYPKFVRDAFFNPNWNETVIHVYLKSWRKESVYLEGSMCVTIKRDALGLPMAIYGHFLTIPIKATQQPSQ
eukprot:TRINITY_DN6608_c0_g1_i1.p1 TRINITY_DN6608_c0_g1~~TRINITY_DN6608_c0_g1_i1.p1  ORF type:complete len:622 (+),score=186.40 TRINITY_DN6608_c0_g1_i1:208-2073(+)